MNFKVDQNFTVQSYWLEWLIWVSTQNTRKGLQGLHTLKAGLSTQLVESSSNLKSTFYLHKLS